MNAGRLDKRITIQKYSGTQNEYGEQEKTWSDVRTCWASVEPLQGKELFAARQFISNVDYRFRTRYWSTTVDMPDKPTPKMRIFYNSNYYDIESVINTKEDNREYEFMCVRVVT